MVSPEIIMTTPTKENIVASVTENAEDIIKFSTTPKGSKQYNYQNHEWNCSEQLDVHNYLRETQLPFKKGGLIKQNDKKTCRYEICVNDEFKDVTNLVYLIVYVAIYSYDLGDAVAATVKSVGIHQTFSHSWLLLAILLIETFYMSKPMEML